MTKCDGCISGRFIVFSLFIRIVSMADAFFVHFFVSPLCGRAFFVFFFAYDLALGHSTI